MFLLGMTVDENQKPVDIYRLNLRTPWSTERSMSVINLPDCDLDPEGFGRCISILGQNSGIDPVFMGVNIDYQITLIDRECSKVGIYFNPKIVELDDAVETVRRSHPDRFPINDTWDFIQVIELTNGGSLHSSLPLAKSFLEGEFLNIVTNNPKDVWVHSRLFEKTPLEQMMRAAHDVPLGIGRRQREPGADTFIHNMSNNSYPIPVNPNQRINNPSSVLYKAVYIHNTLSGDDVGAPRRGARFRENLSNRQPYNSDIPPLDVSRFRSSAQFIGNGLFYIQDNEVFAYKNTGLNAESPHEPVLPPQGQNAGPAHHVPVTPYPAQAAPQDVAPQYNSVQEVNRPPQQAPAQNAYHQNAGQMQTPSVDPQPQQRAPAYIPPARPQAERQNPAPAQDIRQGGPLHTHSHQGHGYPDHRQDDPSADIRTYTPRQGRKISYIKPEAGAPKLLPWLNSKNLSFDINFNDLSFPENFKPFDETDPRLYVKGVPMSIITRKGVKWSAEETQFIIDEFVSGSRLVDLVAYIGRTPKAITAQLFKVGVTTFNPYQEHEEAPKNNTYARSPLEP